MDRLLLHRINYSAPSSILWVSLHSCKYRATLGLTDRSKVQSILSYICWLLFYSSWSFHHFENNCDWWISSVLKSFYGVFLISISKSKDLQIAFKSLDWTYYSSFSFSYTVQPICQTASAAASVPGWIQTKFLFYTEPTAKISISKVLLIFVELKVLSFFWPVLETVFEMFSNFLILSVEETGIDNVQDYKIDPLFCQHNHIVAQKSPCITW